MSRLDIFDRVMSGAAWAVCGYYLCYADPPETFLWLAAWLFFGDRLFYGTPREWKAARDQQETA